MNNIKATTGTTSSSNTNTNSTTKYDDAFISSLLLQEVNDTKQLAKQQPQTDHQQQSKQHSKQRNNYSNNNNTNNSTDNTNTNTNNNSITNRRNNNYKRSRYESSQKDDNNYYQSQTSQSIIKSADETTNNNDNNNENTCNSIEKEKPNFGLSGALTLSLESLLLQAKSKSNSNSKDDTTSTNTTKPIINGIVYKGIQLKFVEPKDAMAPLLTKWRLHVYKNDQQIHIYYINKQSAYLIGKHVDICDILLDHPSISNQHAVLQYRNVCLIDDNNNVKTVQPYLIDLQSTNGTYINTIQIEHSKYYQLKYGDVIQFGSSLRQYILLHE